jgi:membrane-associated phospholipid phosphatase
MFLTAPVVWLQAWASPGLTRTMEVISWFGYTRTAITLAVFIAFAFRPRGGMALLLLLGLNSLATDVAKTSAALPRPFAVDPAVRILGWPAPAPLRWGTAATGWWDPPRRTPPPSTEIAGERANAADSETGFGFPSGHVSTTAAFVAGLAGLVGRRWVRVAGVAWLSLMAVSRLYLGRHFIADVLGGLALGSLVVGLGLTMLRLSALAQSRKPREVERAALINGVVAAVLLGVSLIAGWPDIGDAGRLAGIALAVLLLMRSGMVHLPPRPMARAGLVTIAAASYALVWAALTFGLQPSRGAASTGSRLAASALPAFAMLFVPAASVRMHRVAALARRDA